MQKIILQSNGHGNLHALSLRESYSSHHGNYGAPHCGISVYKIGATPTVLLFIKFGLIRLLPWRPLNCAPWFWAIKLKIADAREHHEFPRLRKYRFAAPTATRAIAVASRRQTRLPSRPSQVKFQARMAKQKARGTHPT